MRVEEEEESSSEREGGRRVTWPKMRPSTEPGEVEKRWMREAKAGPEMAIFSTEGSSIAETETSFGESSI